MTYTAIGILFLKDLFAFKSDFETLTCFLAAAALNTHGFKPRLEASLAISALINALKLYSSRQYLVLKSDAQSESKTESPFRKFPPACRLSGV